MIPLAKPVIGPREEELVLEVLRSGQLSLGPMLPRFERAFAERMGAGHASAVSSGTAGLHLALRAVGVDVPGQMSVVSFDEDECLAFLEVPVTSVAMPLAELGGAAGFEVGWPARDDPDDGGIGLAADARNDLWGDLGEVDVWREWAPGRGRHGGREGRRRGRRGGLYVGAGLGGLQSPRGRPEGSAARGGVAEDGEDGRRWR